MDTANTERTSLCDRCGHMYSFVDLRPQYEYAAFGLVNTGKLVCATCWDEPAPFLKAKIIPPDPPPQYGGRQISFPSDDE